MKTKAVLIRAFAPMINLLTDIVNIFIWRDRRIILCGAWMGRKFADNSRNLYQYLFENRERYGLKKVIWVTRSEKVYDTLVRSGYEVYRMHSIKSIYYHFRAGVYIICNMGFYASGYPGDTMGHLAGHAVKINTWHGIPLKAGKSTGQNTRGAGVTGRITYTLRNSRLFCSVFTPGHWDRSYYLSTGRECTRRCAVFQGVGEDRFIEAGYPRDCMATGLMDREKEVMSYIRGFRDIILYVPTFREHGSFPHPMEDPRFRGCMSENGYLWIEKPHPAAEGFCGGTGDGTGYMRLEADFDINVILPEISLLVTDYSSVCFDAAAYRKPVLYYAPDYERYLHEERGFLCDYREFAGDCLSVTAGELKGRIISFFSDAGYKRHLEERADSLRREMFDGLSFSGEAVVGKIGNRTGIFRRTSDWSHGVYGTGQGGRRF